MSELKIKQIDKENYSFTLQSELPESVMKYPVTVTATLDDGTTVEQTNYVTIRVTPTISIVGPETVQALAGEGAEKYTFTYDPEKYNVGISLSSVKTDNSCATILGSSKSGFTLIISGLTEDTTINITAVFKVDNKEVTLTKEVFLDYREDTNPFILYNTGESADVSIKRNNTSVPMTQMYYKVVSDYVEGETYDDSEIEYDLWELTTASTQLVANVGTNQAILFKAVEKKRWSGQYNAGYVTQSSIYSMFVLGETGQFKAYGSIGAIDGYYSALGSGCYLYLFYNCKSLIKAPELPAKNLVSGCYAYMFYNTRITEAPELPGITTVQQCYWGMFKNCTSLTKAPELPLTSLSSKSYNEMFSGCTSLKEAPELPATSIGDTCYDSMFYGCTSLVKPPKLPCTYTPSSCYASMFKNCVSLTEAPELPSTSMTQSCYAYMFSGCKSLERAPRLPAKILSNNCYHYMFENCTSLVYLRADYTTESSANTGTFCWVSGVNTENGIYIGNINFVQGLTKGSASGVPSKWTYYNSIQIPTTTTIKASSTDGTGFGHVNIDILLEPGITEEPTIELTAVTAVISMADYSGCELSFSNLSKDGFDVTVSGYQTDCQFTCTATFTVNGKTTTRKGTILVQKSAWVDGTEHYTLEKNSSPIFTVSSDAEKYLTPYLAKVGGYLLYPTSDKVYATKLDADDWNYFEDGSDATEYVPKCETMVYFPKCCYQSKGKKFRFGGISGEFGQIFHAPEWVGAYLMYVDDNGVGHSRPDCTPAYNKSLEAFWKCAQGLGEDWGLPNYEFHCLLNALYQTKYGNLNSQTVIGSGGTCSTFSDWRDVKMGYGRVLGDGSGQAATSMSGQNCVKLFGLEDYWAKLNQWTQGVWMQNNKVHVYYDNAASCTLSDRSWSSSLNSSGYGDSCYLGDNGHWDMIGKSFSGNSNSYYCDWMDTRSSSSSAMVLYVGSTSNSGSLCGVSGAGFSLEWGYSDAWIGGRLSFYGSVEIEDTDTFKSHFQ